MNMVDLIVKKRNGSVLSAEEIAFFVRGVTTETIPDYQTASLLMAIYFQGLTTEETAALTMEMAHSGTLFDLSALPGIKVDKHSTGGVSDTTTLILAPLVASLGVPVVKMSGRGLGFSGGTLDKLDAIPGFTTALTQKEALALAQASHIALLGQTDTLTPADQKLYALRDVTGTVENSALIASSIMSKKIAAGADAIVLDVKCGSGAFMKSLPDAKALAEEMVSIGKAVHKEVSAIVSSMVQPLGNHIGNSLEVIEAIEILKGNLKQCDLLTVSLTLGAMMLRHAKKAAALEEGKALLQEQITNGKGLETFQRLIEQQKGDPHILQDYSLLPHASCELTVCADSSGYITAIQTALLGRASQETGAGRMQKTDRIDLGAGIVMKVRLGDWIAAGSPLAIVYANTPIRCEAAAAILQQAITISKTPTTVPELLLAQIE